MAPGYDKFELFCQSADIEYDREQTNPMICTPAETEKELKDEHMEETNPSMLNWPRLDQSIDGSSTEHLQGPRSTQENVGKIELKLNKEKSGNDDSA